MRVAKSPNFGTAFERRRVPGRAQPRHDPHDVGGAVDRAHLVEQPQPLGREQRAQFGGVHPGDDTGWQSH
jgi:hypothetical protein